MTGNRRLSYTRSAFLRRVAMSRDKLFLVVEGRDFDVPFYSRVCESSAIVMAEGYQIWLVEQIRDDVTGKRGGGKPAVLSFFDFCKRRKALRIPSPQGDRVLTFCLDRDNEQITGGGRRSPHILYTRSSDVEAEILSQGLDEDLMMSSLSLDRSTAQGVVKSLGDWQLEFALSWREWIELCCLAKSLKSRCDVGFGTESTVNNPKYGPADANLVAAARTRVLSRSRLSPIQTPAVEVKVASKLARVYTNGNPRCLIKGKWMPAFLHYKVRQYFGQSPVSFGSFVSSITTLMVHSIDYSAKWADCYRRRLEVNL